MKIVNIISALRNERRKIKGSLGLVPTMGALHEGHLALVRRARAENDVVAATIFVNPTQFGPQEDLAVYPRSLEKDLDMLKTESVDLVFAPDDSEMYPVGFDTWVEVPGLSRRLEGASRPSHFRGVATVVHKLFSITRPDRAYFGQKDAQQVLVIKRLARDLDTGVEIRVVPTVREADGLAMSSRNVFLNSEERKAAPVLYRSLQTAQGMYRSGRRDAEAIRQAMLRLVAQEPLASVDYVSVANAETLDELGVIDRPALVSLAVCIGKTRLIDNVTLG